MGLVSRRGRRGRPPKLSVTTEQQAQRRRERLQEVRALKDRFENLNEVGASKTLTFCFVPLTNTCCFQLVEQCEDEELMDIVLPRLTKILSAWELLLAKVAGADLKTLV